MKSFKLAIAIAAFLFASLTLAETELEAVKHLQREWAIAN